MENDNKNEGKYYPQFTCRPPELNSQMDTPHVSHSLYYDGYYNTSLNFHVITQRLSRLFRRLKEGHTKKNAFVCVCVCLWRSKVKGQRSDFSLFVVLTLEVGM